MTALFATPSNRNPLRGRSPAQAGDAPPPASAVLIGEWDLDEASGTAATDDQGLSTGTYLGTIEFGVSSIVAGDATSSIGLNGVDSGVTIPHVAGMLLSSYSLHGYAQADQLPASGSHFALFNKDVNATVAGGVSVEFYNDAGTGRIRAYTRTDTGTGVWVGGSTTGFGSLAAATAFSWTLTVGIGGTNLYINEVLAASSTNTQGWQSNTRNIQLYLWSTSTTPFDGVGKRFRLYSGELLQADITALANAQSVSHGGGTSAITLDKIYMWKNENPAHPSVSLGPLDLGELKITDTAIGGTIASSSGGTLPAFPITVDPTPYVNDASGGKTAWTAQFRNSTKGTWTRLAGGDFQFTPGTSPGLDQSEYRVSDNGGATWSPWQGIVTRVLDRSLCPGPYFLVEDYSPGGSVWNGVDTLRFNSARDAANTAGGGTVTTLVRGTKREVTQHVLKPNVHYLFCNIISPRCYHTSDLKTTADYPSGGGPSSGWEPTWQENVIESMNNALAGQSRVNFVGGIVDGNVFLHALMFGSSLWDPGASEYGKAWPGIKNNSSYFNIQFRSTMRIRGSSPSSGGDVPSLRANVGLFGIWIKDGFNGLWGPGSVDALIEDSVFSGCGRGGAAFDSGNTKVVSRRNFLCNSLGGQNTNNNICSGVDYEILGYGSSFYQDITEEDDIIDNDFETESRDGVQQFNGCIIGPFHECRAKGTVAPTTITFQGSAARPRGIIRYHRARPVGGNYPGCGINGWGGTNPHNMTTKFIDQDFITWGSLYIFHEKIIVPVAGTWEIEVGETVDTASAFRIELTNCTASVGANMPSGSNTIRLFRTVKALTTAQVVRIDGLTIGSGFVQAAVSLNGQRLEYRNVTHQGFPGSTISQICPGAGQYVAI